MRDATSLAGLAGGSLVIECSPCGRRGVFSLDRLRQRYGTTAPLLDVFLTLTESCPWQVRCGARLPNQYGRACRARIASGV